ncbi:MAG: SDR family NAD(P)-dependent oxidoreductase [bacterium]|nr:SDR family NAD(P)-dependent oxidoreductase [bacterium]MDE0601716.1 SDR family NAD(P)-dependent oxidoreductase [bacterium]
MTGAGQSGGRKSAILTGAGRGIGKGIATTLAERGYDLVITSRTRGDLEVTGRLVEEVGGAAAIVVADLKDPDTPSLLVGTALDRYGRLDGLVNNAAVNVFAPFWTQSETTLDETIATNLTAPYFLCQAAANHWVENGLGGAIVNISSAEDTIAYPEQVPYACSKGGLLSLTKVLALEWGPLGIRVNAVSPGSVDTEMTPDVYRQEAPKLMPIGRLGRPEDIGACVFFLLSDDAAFVTGTALYADGGYMLQ